MDPFLWQGRSATALGFIDTDLLDLDGIYGPESDYEEEDSEGISEPDEEYLESGCESDYTTFNDSEDEDQDLSSEDDGDASDVEEEEGEDGA